MIRPASFLLLLLLPLSGLALAETREWKSADGSSSFRGDYLSHGADKVSIRHADGRVFEIELEKLHADDRAWLARRDLPDSPPDAEIPAHAVFDTLCFGDTRREVEDKLKQSKFVEAAMDETFFGRFGLNGTFRTQKQIGGLHCELYFDWTASGGLKEISLRTQSLGPDAYTERMRNNWSELSELLTQLHGKPLQTGPYPKITDLQNDLFLASHLWRLENGGTAMLGTSMTGDQYQVVVRFTTETIEPVRVP